MRELQPNAVIFSDAGPDVRWVGNEDGFAGETNWSTLRRDEFYPGSPNYKELNNGHADGNYWVPAECDVSIRPGWYYHPEQDDKVKSVEQLTDIYYKSVGRNGLLLLNIPVDKRGLIHENDAARLMELKKALQKDFAVNFTEGPKGASKKVTAVENEQGSRITSIEVDLSGKKSISMLVLQEKISMGQRVSSFRVFAQQNGNWTPIAGGTTIGYKRILRFAKIETDKVKIEFEGSGPLAISEVGIYQ